MRGGGRRPAPGRLSQPVGLAAIFVATAAFTNPATYGIGVPIPDIIKSLEE